MKDLRYLDGKNYKDIHISKCIDKSKSKRKTRIFFLLLKNRIKKTIFNQIINYYIRFLKYIFKVVKLSYF